RVRVQPVLARGRHRHAAGAGRGAARGGDRRRRRARIRRDARARRERRMTEMTAIAMGVHVLDVLVRPVEAIPEGQGGQLVEEIRITPAGSAGGTAVTLAKLGANVRSAGAIGTDALGDVVLELLGRFEVQSSLLARRY